MSIDIIVILLVVLLCSISIYTDLSQGVVKNKVLFYVGIPAIIINLANQIYNVSISNIEYLLTVGSAIIISFVLYFMRIWAGGDCKLFIVLSLSMPFNIVTSYYFKVSGIIFCILLSFVMGYVFLTIESVILKIKNKDKATIDLKIVKKNFIEYLKYYFILIFINGFLEIVFLENNSISCLILAIDFCAIWFLKKFKILEYDFIMPVFVVVDIVLSFQGMIRIISIKTICIWILVILMQILNSFVSFHNYEKIEFENLKVGMILSMASSYYLCSMKGLKFSKISDESLKSRLSLEEVDNIKKWAIDNSIESTIVIVRKIPFAIFISLSAIIVIIITELRI